MSIMNGKGIRAALVLAACCHLTPALADSLACDDGIKTAFRPDADTKVVARPALVPGRLVRVSV